MSKNSTEKHKPAPKPSVIHIIISTLAAAVGVQSNRNRERDFAANNLYVYVAAGILFATIFIGGLIIWVRHLIGSG